MKPHKHAELIKANLHRFDYCFGGILKWHDNYSPRARKGEVVGSKDTHGYLQVKIQGKNVFVHQIVWLMFNDELPEQIDHIDRQRTNNAIKNLREANNMTNQHNASMRKDNSSGVIGVHARNGRYQARIQCNGKRIQLGTFDTIEEASKAYQKGKETYHGQTA